MPGPNASKPTVFATNYCAAINHFPRHDEANPGLWGGARRPAARRPAGVGWPGGNAPAGQALRVISGLIIIGFQIPFAGRAVVTVQADSVKIGRKDGTVDAVVRDMAEAFNAAKIPAESVNNIQMHLWGKVLYNASLNPLGGI